MAGEYVDELVDLSISSEIVTFILPDGRKMHMPLRLFRVQHAKHTKILAEYDGRVAAVVPIKRARRRH